MNRRLIVLDDEADIRDHYSFVLNPPPSTAGNVALAAAREPYEIFSASTGEDALATIERNFKVGTPLVGGFFDHHLGKGIDGVETIRRAKELDPNFLCVLVTGRLDRSIEEIEQIFGADYADRWDFVIKPFSQIEIVQKASRLVMYWDRRKRETEYIRQIEAQREQLGRAERLAALSTMARGLGQEFGNILHRILGKADTALESRDAAKMETALRTIVTATEEAGVLVRNLQSLVKMEPSRELLSLGNPLREALGILQFELKKGKITLREEGTGSLPTLRLNRVEMTQAFLNILLNAIQATDPAGGVLTVGVTREAGGIALNFQDTGCGIPPENLNRIFEPLFTTRIGHGSGIGLSVSRRIVENHGGRISVKSQVGKGATFTIWLPDESGAKKG